MSPPADSVSVEPNTDPTIDEIAVEPMLQLFRHQHLPPPLKSVAQSFAMLARKIVHDAGRNPERSAALRKLREAKDCACTALLWKDPERPPPTRIPGPGVLGVDR